MSMVEMVGVEPTSESISAGISPSAVNVFEFRFFGRPLTDFRSGYPVSPLRYRELPQSFPVWSTPVIRPTGKPEPTREQN